MNKKEVQKRVLQNGKPIALSKFTWDESTNTFSSNENGLVVDFEGVSHCTFKTGSHCTFTTWTSCTFTTGACCTFTTEDFCTFTTGSDCTFTTGACCTFNTGSDCVIVRRDLYEVIEINEGKKYQLLPYAIKGFLTAEKESDIWYNQNSEEAVVIDGIYSKVKSRKGNVLKVVNYGEENESYIVGDGEGKYAHGESIKEAKEDLLYKLIGDAKKDDYKGLPLSHEFDFKDALTCYRAITGACSTGMKNFVNQHEVDKEKKYSIESIISITKGAYGSREFSEFFNQHEEV